MKTLAVRMDRHCANAAAVADALAGHPAVASVLYPGPAPTIPATASPPSRCGTSGAWSRSCCGAAGTPRTGSSARTTVFTLAESLGAVESLIEHPGAMTHASVAGSPLQVDDALVRLSVGLETVGDLLADLRQALDPEA